MQRFLLAIEFIVVYIVIPSAIFLRFITLNRIAILIILCATSVVFLASEPEFSIKTLLRTKIKKGQILWVLKRFLLSVPALLLLGMILVPDDLFTVPGKDPLFWTGGSVIYILLSVIPQEILYRVFFFHRYRKLFPGKGLLLFASTVVFSFVHIIYLNLVAVALTLAGGYFFSKTYQETDSFLLTVIEHSIYGCFLFALGLGPAFS